MRTNIPLPAITTGKLTVNLNAKIVEVDGSRVCLSRSEYKMLELLSLRKGTTLSKGVFIDYLYGGMNRPERNIIHVFMCKLRKKLSAATNGDACIETIRGYGYLLRDQASREAARR